MMIHKVFKYLRQVPKPTASSKRKWQDKPATADILKLTTSFEEDQTEYTCETAATSACSSKTKFQPTEPPPEVEMTDENTFDNVLEPEKLLEDVEMTEEHFDPKSELPELEKELHKKDEPRPDSWQLSDLLHHANQIKGLIFTVISIVIMVLVAVYSIKILVSVHHDLI